MSPQVQLFLPKATAGLPCKHNIFANDKIPDHWCSLYNVKITYFLRILKITYFENYAFLRILKITYFLRILIITHFLRILKIMYFLRILRITFFLKITYFEKLRILEMCNLQKVFSKLRVLKKCI